MEKERDNYILLVKKYNKNFSVISYLRDMPKDALDMINNQLIATSGIKK